MSRKVYKPSGVGVPKWQVNPIETVNVSQPAVRLGVPRETAAGSLMMGKLRANVATGPLRPPEGAAENLGLLI